MGAPKGRIMKRATMIFLVSTVVTIAGCGGVSDNFTTVDGEEGNTSAKNANVVLPPSILLSKIYRCKDNSVVYIDWLSDMKSANLRTERNGPRTRLAAPTEGEAMVAEGYSLTGTSEAASVTLTRPGAGSQSCKS